MVLTAITWPTISAAVRSLKKPILLVTQKAQDILHPIWVDTHNVLRSSSGMNTLSMRRLSEVANMNLMEPSSEVFVSRTSGRPKWNMFFRVTRKPFGRLVIRLKSARSDW